MKFFLLCCAFALTAPLLAEDTSSDRTANPSVDAYRQSLHDARQRYQDAVRTYGSHSKQADDARQQVRESRRVFHAQRRAAQHS